MYSLSERIFSLTVEIVSTSLIINFILAIHPGIVKVILMIPASIDKITFTISLYGTLAEFRFPC